MTPATGEDRNRRARPGSVWTLLAVSMVLAAGLIAVLVFSSRKADLPGKEGANRAAAAPAENRAQVRSTWSVRDTLRPGETIYESLLEHGGELSEVVAVTRTLARSLPPRKVRAGDWYEAVFDSSGSMMGLLYRRGLTEEYRVGKTGAGWSCTASPVILSRKVQKIRGQIDGSLFTSMIAAGGDPEIVMNYADIFAWDIDFLTEPRAGDAFMVLVEKLYDGGREVGFGRILFASYLGRVASAEAVLVRTSDEDFGYYDLEGKSLRKSFLKSPLNYRRISSYFSRRRFHPILKIYRPHLGIDYAAPRGTPVVAVAGGVVQRAGWNGGFGKFVKIRHNATFTTTYGHFSRIARGIRKGVRVKQGQVIGYVGATGLATGPHLDYRVIRNGKPVDPLRLKVKPVRTIAASMMGRFRNVLLSYHEACYSMREEAPLDWAVFWRDYLPGLIEPETLSLPQSGSGVGWVDRRIGATGSVAALPGSPGGFLVDPEYTAAE